MHAIRSRTGEFRRGGILFAALAWTLVSGASAAQLTEPHLEAREVPAGFNDETLDGIPVSNPGEPVEMAPGGEGPSGVLSEDVEELQQELIDLGAAKNAADRKADELLTQLNSAISEREAAEAKAASLTSERDELQKSVEDLTNANALLVKERDESLAQMQALFSEKATLQTQVDDLTKERDEALAKVPAEGASAAAQTPETPADVPAAPVAKDAKPKQAG